MPSFAAAFLKIYLASDIFFYAALICASFGTVLYGSEMVKAGEKDLSFFLFLLSLSLVAGISLSVFFDSRTGFSFPFYSIEGLSGKAEEDSRSLPGEMSGFSIEVSGIAGTGITEVSGRGRCRIIFRGKGRYFKGQRVFIEKKIFLEKRQGVPVIRVDKRDIHVLGWSGRFMEMRASVIDALERKISLLDPGTADLFKAVFLGRKDDPSNRVFTGFVRSGASHVLALSGMHLGIIAGLLFTVLKPLLGRHASFWISQPVLIFYLFITGASPSLQRSYLFLFSAGCVWLYAGIPDPLHVLSFVFVIHLLISPVSCESVSFRLSYAALAGIFMFGKSAERMLPRLVPSWAGSVLSASLGAQAATLPIAVYYFGTVYTAGIISSLVLVPAVSLFAGMGFLYIIMPPVFLGAFSAALNLVYLFLKESTSFFSMFPSYFIARTRYVGFQTAVFIILTLIFLVEYPLYRIKRINAGDDGDISGL